MLTSKSDTEEIGLMSVLGDISEAYGAYQTIMDMIHPQPSLSDIVALIVAEVNEIFLEGQATEDIRNASATLQSLHDFFAQNYKNAIDNGQTNTQLYHTLTDGSAAPNLTDFDAFIALIKSWADTFNNAPTPSRSNIACQAISFCLAAYLHLAMYYKEKSRVNDNDADKNTDWATMRSKAQEAVINLSPILNALQQCRINSINIIRGDGADDYFDTLTDNYISLSYTTRYDNANDGILSSAFLPQLYKYWTSGSDDDWNTFVTAFQNNNDWHSEGISDFTATAYSNYNKFGKWYINGLKAIELLSTIANAPYPTIAPAANGNPCIVQFQKTNLHIVYRDVNNQIADISWNGSCWQYENLSELAVGGPPAANGDPCIAQYFENFLHIVYKDVNNQIGDINWNGSGWKYQNLNTLDAVVAANGGPAPAANGDPRIAQNFEKSLHIVYRDVNNQFSDISWDIPTQAWKYKNLSTEPEVIFNAPAINGNPCIVPYSTNQLCIVYRDGGDWISNIVCTTSTWGYENLSNVPTVTPPNALGNPCMLAYLDSFHIVYRDVNNQISDIYYTNDSFIQYENLSVIALDGPPPAANGDPCILQYLGNYPQIVYRDVNNQIANIYWDGSFWRYRNLNKLTNVPVADGGPGGPPAPAANGDPSIAQTDKSLHIVYMDVNNEIADISWNGSAWQYQKLNGWQ